NRMDLNSGETQLLQELTIIRTLNIDQGVVLNLMDNNRIRILEDIQQENTSGNAALIKATDKGIFIHELYKKYCLENIHIENVDFSGDAVINLGPNSQVNNGANWLSMNCGTVLFTNFESSFTCEGALVEFTNTTEGPVSNYKW